MSVAAARVGSVGDDDQRKPFREMWQFKAVTLTALPAVTTGIVATGAPIAKYYQHAPADRPGAAAGVATYDRADPYHSDPGGEFIRIEPRTPAAPARSRSSSSPPATSRLHPA
jgi:hypothetical protein